MKIKKTSWLYLALVLVLIVSLFAGLTGADEECEPCEPELVVDLIAGQNMVVGSVTVTNDDEKVCVTYALDEDALEEGWLIYETHLAIATEKDGIPQTPGNRWGTNPIPGLFPYGDDELDGVEEWSFCVSLDELGVEFCNEVFIAAHAVIERVECEVLAEAPYGGSEVIDAFQAWRIDHTPEAPRYVKVERSDPDNALEIGIPGQETFYSLGYGGALNEEKTAVGAFFGEYFEDRRDPDAIREMEGWVDEDLAAILSDTENNAGWIIIEFDPPAVNVDGEYDIQAVEDTWGLPYPLELAAVFGRADAGDDWSFLFLAHNQEPVGSPTYHTYTNGELGDLEQAVQILVQDVSDPQWFIPYPHSVATLDGYDLNAIVALNDHVDCEEFDETAWGEGDRFNERGNWGMWFKYKICEPCPEPELINGDFEFPVVDTTQGWQIYPSGTEGLGWTVEWMPAVPEEFGNWDRPDPAYLELHRTGVGEIPATWTAYEGNQYAELDTDWDGPGGSLNNEPATVKIYQDIDTCGQLFTLKYAWSPRPGHADNKLEVYWNGALIDTHEASGAGLNATSWTFETHTDLESNPNSTTRLEFKETGTPNSFGMFLDAVSIEVQ